MTNFLTQKNNFESTNFDMFEEVVHNFGKSEGDIHGFMSNLIKKSWTDSSIQSYTYYIPAL